MFARWVRIFGVGYGAVLGGTVAVLSTAGPGYLPAAWVELLDLADLRESLTLRLP